MKKALIILLSLSLASCGVTKTKSIEETSIKKEKVEVVEKKAETTEVKTEEETKVIKTDSIAEKEEKTVTRSESEEVDIVADSTGVVTREVVKTSDGYKETYTGVQSVSLRDKTETEEKSLKEHIRLLRSDSIMNRVEDSISRAEWSKKEFLLKEELKTRKKDKTEKIGNWFWWFIGSLGINVLLITYIARKRIKKLISYTLYTLLGCVILLGCNHLEEGTVVNKHYEPMEKDLVVMPLIMSNGETTTTMMIPYLVTDNEDYVLHIKGIYKGEEIIEQVYTSKECYENMQNGDSWTKTKYCSFSDNNNQKERRD